VEIDPFSAVGDFDLPGLARLARKALAGRFTALDPDSLVLVDRRQSSTRSGAVLAHLSLRQAVDRIPIHGTWLNLTTRRGDRRAPARLVASSYRLFESPQVETTPVISETAAVTRSRQALRNRTGRLRRSELVIRQLGPRLELVWQVAIQGSHARALVIASGPRAGSSAVVDDRVFAGGQVTGFFAQDGAPGGAGTVLSAGLRNLQVNAAGASAMTDENGSFTLDVADGTPVSATLTGQAVAVNNLAGPTLTATATAGPEIALGFADGAAGQLDLAQVNGYVYVDRVRSFLESNGVPSAALGVLTTNVNLFSTCNAYYMPGEVSINFFQAGNGCNNTAIDTVIYHEYGHYVDDVFGGILGGGLSEGWGDLLACLARQSPELGEDFFTGSSAPLRTCDNSYVYPPGGNDEVHALGQAWSGFGWHARAGLIAALGAGEGDALARALLLPSLPSNAADIPAAVREVFLRDDDDGDLANLTPHWPILLAAAEQRVQLLLLGDSAGPDGRKVRHLHVLAAG
jgi:hypothetical protein